MDHKVVLHHGGTLGLHHQRALGVHFERAVGLHSQRSSRLHEQNQDIDKKEQHPPIHDPDFLRKQARWIRDDLDSQVARDGPDVLHSDDILDLDELFRALLSSCISLEAIRYSRIHLAIAAIAGRATRWPSRLVPRCDALKEAWEVEFGPLKQIGILLYEPGGRLHRVCTADDFDRGKLMAKWIESPDVKISPMVARRFGDLGFKPGEQVRPSN